MHEMVSGSGARKGLREQEFGALIPARRLKVRGIQQEGHLTGEQGRWPAQLKVWKGQHGHHRTAGALPHLRERAG